MSNIITEIQSVKNFAKFSWKLVKKLLIVVSIDVLITTCMEYGNA